MSTRFYRFRSRRTGADRRALALVGLITVCWCPAALADEGDPPRVVAPALEAPAAETTASPVEAARPPATDGETKTASPHGRHPRGIALGAGIIINGRFDLNYERNGFTDDPGDGKDALKNYHRYLFISRHAKDDPYFFNAEVLGLSFYEFGFRLRGDDAPWRLKLTAGKILVPFGSEPLYHHAYGGLVGSDQRYLPIVWGEYGIKLGLGYALTDVDLRADLYIVRGNRLSAVDGILNFQSNVSPTDDVTFAGGLRLGASYGAASVYYSLYYGGIGFGRHVAMQALDLTIWRIADIPVLRDLAFTAGVARTDVFAGDAPAYYNFADYLQLRYYPLDFLYLQYRGGLHTVGNESGVFVDASRLTTQDASAHSITLGFQEGGISLALMYLWQLELADEIPNDLIRLSATYEF